MAFNISDKTLSAQLERHLGAAQRVHADSLEKLSSGQVFTPSDPRPADRAVADGLEFKVRSLSSAKRNINDAVSLLQTAESGLQEVNNIVIRMKEINVAGASTTITDRERRYLFIEYQALHDEVDRIAETTNFNGIPLLNGKNPAAPEQLIFRVGDPQPDSESSDSEGDINTIRFDGLRQVVATTVSLGIKSARKLLLDSNDREGISLDDAQELMTPENSDDFPTVYDQAMTTLASQRAVFGALQTRMNRAMDFVDVYQENIAAAKSHIADTDYASEVSRLVQSKLLIHAASSLMAHTNMTGQLTNSLLATINS